MMKHIKVVKDKEAPESAELLASSVVAVAEGFKKILATPLTERALVVLLQDGIGAAHISKVQIKLVLEALPRLKAWYIKG
jgi:hypothetical protein